MVESSRGLQLREWADNHLFYRSTPPDIEAAYRQHTAKSASLWTRWVLGLAMVSAIGFWPVDTVFFEGNPQIIRTLAMTRFAVAITSALGFWLVSEGRPLSSRPNLVLGACMLIGGFSAALAYGSLGGIEQPWFYHGYAVMALSLLMSVPLVTRFVFTFVLGGVWLIAFFFPWEGNANTPFLLSVLVFQLYVAAFVVLGGHLVYHLGRRDYFQSLALAEKSEALAQEKKVSEALLLNVLPASVAEQLKSGHQPIAERFDAVSVLFADISGFTPLSRSLPPQAIVGLLNEIFSAFDALSERYGVEKIKTLGDAYMAAAGLPERRPDHAQVLSNMALEMIAVVSKIATPDGGALKMRIGIATGPVVAGVIGKKRFIYDLWGDTVNAASRMESHGQVGRIQVTQKTQRVLAQTHRFVSRGKVDIKGMGPMETFFLEGKVGDVDATVLPRPQEAL